MSHLHPFALQTPRLLIRRFFLGEVDDFVSYRNDPGTLQLQPWLAPLSKADAWSFFTCQVATNPGEWNSQVHVAIVYQSTGQVIGDCYVRVDSIGRVGDFGVTLARAWQNKGFEEEAVRVMLYWACVCPDGPGLERLTCKVDKRNSAMLTSLRAAGFAKLSQGAVGGRFPYLVLQYTMY